MEHFAATDAESIYFCVRERNPRKNSVFPSPGDVELLESSMYRISLDAMREWPLDFTLVEINRAGAQVSTGAWGSAPVYLSDIDGTLYGSWLLPDLAQRRGVDGLVDREVCRFLALRHRYGCETVFSGVYRPTERAQAKLTSTGLSITYPTAALHARPRTLRSGAAVLDYYEGLLAQAVQAREYTPEQIVVELSGGLDSANVAMTVASLYPSRCSSYALMLDGPAGQQQTNRRQVLVHRCGFRDLRVAAIEHPPFHPDGRRTRGLPVSPYDEPYSEAFESLLAVAQRAGARVAMTGIGGDELVAPYAAEQEIPPAVAEARRPVPAWLGPRAKQAFVEVDTGTAPGAVLAESSLLASACRAPAFLAAEIWPVSPLCSPNLIRFAESLPFEWRRDKFLHRERLARLGLAPEWIAPPLKENFSHVMEYGLRRYGLKILERLLRESILADYGFIDIHKLADAYRHMACGDKSKNAFFYAALHLESSVRSAC
ncbi:MAG: asparagine synthase [Pseudonocardiales bacterium]|nr:asparagine synthase [Pseudonocardiales bacterium]